MLARGHYCPKEDQQHLQLAAFYPQVAVGYTQMATISTDTHHESQETEASWCLSHAICSVTNALNAREP
jgi:hypothetical protein